MKNFYFYFLSLFIYLPTITMYHGYIPMASHSGFPLLYSSLNGFPKKSDFDNDRFVKVSMDCGDKIHDRNLSSASINECFLANTLFKSAIEAINDYQNLKNSDPIASELKINFAKFACDNTAQYCNIGLVSEYFRKLSNDHFPIDSNIRSVVFDILLDMLKSLNNGVNKYSDIEDKKIKSIVEFMKEAIAKFSSIYVNQLKVSSENIAIAMNLAENNFLFAQNCIKQPILRSKYAFLARMLLDSARNNIKDVNKYFNAIKNIKNFNFGDFKIDKYDETDLNKLGNSINDFILKINQIK